LNTVLPFCLAPTFDNKGLPAGGNPTDGTIPGAYSLAGEGEYTVAGLMTVLPTLLEINVVLLVAMVQPGEIREARLLPNPPGETNVVLELLPSPPGETRAVRLLPIAPPGETRVVLEPPGDIKAVRLLPKAAPGETRVA
jgi:hypothetical protein